MGETGPKIEEGERNAKKPFEAPRVACPTSQIARFGKGPLIVRKNERKSMEMLLIAHFCRGSGNFHELGSSPRCFASCFSFRLEDSTAPQFSPRHLLDLPQRLKFNC